MSSVISLAIFLDSSGFGVIIRGPSSRSRRKSITAKFSASESLVSYALASIQASACPPVTAMLGNQFLMQSVAQFQLLALEEFLD
jgi:hypothetical protein